ncbi:MAG: hypothetical protein HYZ14_03980 [Bacteroidetes bacterium]|nr:hypothetical protein [Bacteroidota bacterium]
MTTEIDHNKLLKKIAKARLKPFGIFQKSQSRIFLHDKGWYTTVIEFQPSKWSKGTFLNIGVDLNLYPRDYFSFGHGYREKGFEEFTDEKQFEDLVNGLCDLTIKRVQELDNLFIDVWAATTLNEKENSDDPWQLYNLALLNILSKNFDRAGQQLDKLVSKKCEHDFEFKRRQLANEILSWLKDENTLQEKIKNLINETRKLKKLPVATLDDLAVRKNNA